MPRLDLAVALGVGVGGALVDVSSYARLTDGLSYRWGRTDAFYGVEPGSFSFTLDNSDGRFTPENPSSPLATTLTEGMSACIQVEGRLTAGVVRSIEPEFPSGEAAWSRVRVTCDDAFGQAARSRPVATTESLVSAAGALGYWKFADSASSSIGVDSGPYNLPSFISGVGSRYIPTFGYDALPWTGETQALCGGPGDSINIGFETRLSVAEFPYETGTGGHYGFWYTPISNVSDGTTHFLMTVNTKNSPSLFLQKGQGSGKTMSIFLAGSTPQEVAMADGVPVYVSVAVDKVAGDARARMYFDGVLVATTTWPTSASTAADFTPIRIYFSLQSQTSASSYAVSQVSHTVRQVALQTARDANTAAEVIQLIADSTQTFDLDTLPVLSDAVIDLGDVEGDSALDVLNLIMETEQGYAYTTTTGTLTAPVEKVVVRGRDRPTTVTATFNVEDELQGAPTFLRDITNLVSTVRVDSTTGSRQTVTDASLAARAGNASDTVDLPLTRAFDMRAWAQDRINRGANTKMQIASVVVDAMTTPTDRSADLLALVPGDRVQFTGLPSTQLGFSTWDGWFLGAEETHTLREHSFALYFQPVLPPVAKYDTGLYMASGQLTLNGAINSSVTSISVTSTGALLSTTNTPYVMQVDDEQMTVTAVTGSSSPQTVTVTRGANGTTAASHSTAAVLVGPVPESIYAF